MDWTNLFIRRILSLLERKKERKETGETLDDNTNVLFRPLFPFVSTALDFRGGEDTYGEQLFRTD